MPPLTPLHLADLRQKHQERVVYGNSWYKEWSYCEGCNEHWPCDTVRLLDALEELREACRLAAWHINSHHNDCAEDGHTSEQLAAALGDKQEAVE